MTMRRKSRVAVTGPGPLDGTWKSSVGEIHRGDDHDDYMDDSKNKDTPKMDGENNGKLY